MHEQGVDGEARAEQGQEPTQRQSFLLCAYRQDGKNEDTREIEVS